VTSLTPADVKRWDPDAIHGVFQTANNRASTLQRLGDSLQRHTDTSGSAIHGFTWDGADDDF
jgi:hypothetical protein